jgi:hypothetical protein
MDPLYFDKVCVDVQALIREVEDAIGIEIDVALDPSIDHLQCSPESRAPRILTPDPDYFPDGGVAHEVLHIKRFRVEGVPQIVDDDNFADWSPDLARGVLSLDNSLEHMVIVPLELAMRAQRRERWEQSMVRVWNGGIQALPNHDDQCRQAMVNWVFLKHVLPDSPIVRTAEALLAQLQARDRAQATLDEVLPSLGSKERATRACFDHLQLERRAALFRYLERATGRPTVMRI